MTRADTVFHADDTVPRSSATDGGHCVDSAQLSWTVLQTQHSSTEKQFVYTRHQSAGERFTSKTSRGNKKILTKMG